MNGAHAVQLLGCTRQGSVRMRQTHQSGYIIRSGHGQLSLQEILHIQLIAGCPAHTTARFCLRLGVTVVHLMTLLRYTLSSHVDGACCSPELEDSTALAMRSRSVGASDAACMLLPPWMDSGPLLGFEGILAALEGEDLAYENLSFAEPSRLMLFVFCTSADRCTGAAA